MDVLTYAALNKKVEEAKNVFDEKISESVNAYLDKNLPTTGATAEQVAQIDKNVADIDELKGDMKNIVTEEGSETDATKIIYESGSEEIEVPTMDEFNSLKGEIADKATLENGVVKFWKASTEESRTDTLLYSVDISSIGGTGGLDLENLTLSVSQVGNYQRLSMSDGTTTKNVDIPITTITDEQVQNAVNNYMAANPIDETDPTVPDWAKNPTKPTYTASEVGALPDTTKIPSKTSDLQNDRGFLTEPQVNNLIDAKLTGVETLLGGGF